MSRKAAASYTVTIKVKSKHGERPDVRTLAGDTIFCSLRDGMTARWTVKKDKR